MTEIPASPSSSNETTGAAPTRRAVLRAAGAAAALGATQPIARASVQEREEEDPDVLRIGLVGCGGRGGGAVRNALRADPKTKLVALADVFPDQIEKKLYELKAVPDIAAQIDVPPENRCLGFDSHEKLTDLVDVVLMASTPHFRPAQVEYAVKAGKHMFVEKPVAVDAPGLRRIWAACDEAKAKKLALVTGLCYRYEKGKQATFKKVHEGAIGDIKAIECSYDTGTLWYREPNESWRGGEMEVQLRNWLYYTWCSGDHIAEQAIHNLDKMIWAMGDRPPLSVKARGGRIARTDPKFGNVYDHFSGIYDFGEGVKGFFGCRQTANADSDVSDHVYGTKGIAHTQRNYIEGENKWRFRLPEGEVDDMYQNEHDAMFASIRSGEPIHDGDVMCRATLLALMGRMSAYTGKVITWDQALASEEDLSPKSYEWGDNPVPPVAQPGITPFV